jgi:hypothetical protein
MKPILSETNLQIIKDIVILPVLTFRLAYLAAQLLRFMRGYAAFRIESILSFSHSHLHCDI